MNHKWANRQTDNNQKEIVERLRRMPRVTVAINHDDLLVGFMGFNFWYEVKNPSCANKKGKVFKSAKKQGQIDLEENWKGHYKIVTTVEEIIDDMKKTIEQLHKELVNGNA